jgi:hypothetical protein
MAEDTNALRFNQVGQMLDEYRMKIYNLELRINLLIKILEEKGIMAGGEYEKRWPIYLKNDIGVIGPDGVMEGGTLKIKFYGC